jgi:hypothetical protein
MAEQAETKPMSRIRTGANNWDEDILNLLNATFHMNAKTGQGEVIEFNTEHPFGIDVQFKIPEDGQKCA